jgi:glycosyltransferase involved in cell wall biosynthesis
MIKTANLTASVSRNAGGLFESVRRLVQSLADTGMEVCVFGTEDEHTAEDIGLWSPVQVKAFRPIGPHQFGYSPQFRRALEEFVPDLVHTHGIWVYPSIVTNQNRRRQGVPYIISVHGMLDPWAVRNSHWKKVIAHFFYEGAHLRDASCLRALCEAEARSLRQFGLTNPIAIIPNGIDLPAIGNRQSAIGNAPWHGFVEPGKKVLLFLSRIHPKKGLMNLLKAWAQNRKSEEWVLALAGWDQGGHEDELKHLATELGIPWADIREQKSEIGNRKSEILFLGPQFNEGKAACYAYCDAFILPSFSEGLPMVVLEAWAYGKPVLMTPECNLPEGFAANAAIRIEPSVESIVQGLEQLLRSPSSDLCSLGTNGRALVAGRFTWPKIAADMKSVYEWVLGGGPKPDCVQTKS